MVGARRFLEYQLIVHQTRVFVAGELVIAPIGCSAVAKYRVHCTDGGVTG